MSFRDKSRAYERDLSFSQKVPHDDTFERRICDHCGLIDYVNPKVIAGVVATWDDKILMCRRAIEPRADFWTLPAGFMEQGETVAAGAAREAREEACAEVETDALIGIYNVTRISQVQIFYRGRLTSPDIAPGPESTEVALLAWDDIPWQHLAFPSVYWALQHYHQTRHEAAFAPFSEPVDWTKTPGFEDLARRYQGD